MNAIETTTPKTIVLAFSGGLDTSYCLHHLVQQGHQVHTVLVDAGGIDAAELQAIEQRALALGATEHHTAQCPTSHLGPIRQALDLVQSPHAR